MMRIAVFGMAISTHTPIEALGLEVVDAPVGDGKIEIANYSTYTLSHMMVSFDFVAATR